MLAPEPLRGEFHLRRAQPRPLVAHPHLYRGAFTVPQQLQRRPHGMFCGLVQQGVVEQIGDRTDQQRRCHRQANRRPLRVFCVRLHARVKQGGSARSLGTRTPLRLLAGLMKRAGNGLSVAVQAFIAVGILDTRQLQQLLQRGLQLQNARIGLPQGIFRNLWSGGLQAVAKRQLRHLHMGFDGGERRAQLMRRIGRPAPLALHAGVDARQQRVQAVHQRRQLGNVFTRCHGCRVLRRALAQLLAQQLERPQAVRANPPRQPQDARERQHKRPHQRAQDRLHQMLPHILAIGGGHANAVVLQYIGAPQLAALDRLTEPARLVVAQIGAVAGAGNRQHLHLAAHQTDLTGHTIAGNE